MITNKDIAMLGWASDGANRLSTCSRKHYMAIITSLNGRVIGTGYNGSPPGYPHCVDGHCPRVQENPEPGSPYGSCVSVHAEANALLWSDRTMREGGTLYVNGPPCWDCAKLICGSGLGRVIHTTDDSYRDFPKVKELMTVCGIEVNGLPLP